MSEMKETEAKRPIMPDAGADNRPLVELTHVEKHYGDLHVLKDINLTVRKGEVLVIVGPSGSGKSTMCRTINRLETIDSGDIRIDGKPLPQEGKELAKLRAEVGMVFQSFAVWPHMNIFENVAFPLRVRKVPKAEMVERVKMALKHTSLDGMEKVRNLLSILPILKRHEGKTVVVKYGGSAIGAESQQDTTLQDVAALRMVGMRVVLVHGGGKHITALLDKLQVPTRFEIGYRYTDQAVLETAEMALSAQVNKAIVSRLSQLEVSAVGLSGKDGGLLTAVEKDPALGRVGSITRVEPRILQTLLDGDFLPVVSPIAAGEDGGGFNCNADDAARAVAAALGADKLIFLTDTAGVLIDSHNSKTAVPHMDVKRAEELIDTGRIAGGMVPKVRGCIQAIRAGVGEVSILDGRVEHALLLEMLNQRVQGTTITG